MTTTIKIGVILVLCNLGFSVVQAAENTEVCECEEAKTGREVKNGAAGVEPIALGSQVQTTPFSLSTHKPNYLLPISYNRNPNDLGVDLGDKSINHVEVQFQFSLKLLLTDRTAGQPHLYVAYTNRSFWQAYNKGLSSPFRDTNHEPEIFYRLPLNIAFGDWEQNNLDFGFVHQSNGRSLPLSRSWNRVYLNWTTTLDDWTFSFKPWYRLPERSKNDADDPRGDDNPDIGDYMGHFEWLTEYRFEKHILTAMVRNNLSSDNRGAIDLTWSYPLSNNVSWYAKWFYGYGETLLDYNHLNNTFGLGFAISNW
ncbi:Putative phospholipase A1 [BD1-7 clade bacterium]|uniref:Phospholipase A1 n=1 Tax=BD1-7 clade bacterium TaxID=2029982 RepID=A0A5S9N4Z8_9GAMM|nr:Putative phospholipase A1 [BD1-7 clade bacterium]CAA0084821.1 Putative phospholipase A1 [BD1-7 clade bacterium]